MAGRIEWITRIWSFATNSEKEIKVMLTPGAPTLIETYLRLRAADKERCARILGASA